jgi:hypothetical protein
VRLSLFSIAVCDRSGAGEVNPVSADMGGFEEMNFRSSTKRTSFIVHCIDGILRVFQVVGGCFGGARHLAIAFPDYDFDKYYYRKH